MARFRKRKNFRRTRRRFNMKRRIPRSINSVMLKRHFISPTITCSSFQAGGMSFQLSDLPGNADIVNLFQMYKICAIKVKWIPVQTMVPSVNTYYDSTTSLPVAYYPDIRPFRYVVDYTNVATPSVASLLEYNNMKEFIPTHTRSIYFKPRIAVATYSGVAFDGYANMKGWIDTASTTVEHYGIRYAWQFGNGSPAITPQVTMYIKARYTY